MHGYHRAYMMFSTRNRGTPDIPGLLVSLAPGGRCPGLAMRLDPGMLDEQLAYLDEREGVGRAHRRVVVPLEIKLDGGARFIPAWTYLPRQDYSNYIGGIPLKRQAELVARAAGKTGTAYEYLENLVLGLRKMGVVEGELERLYQETQAVRIQAKGNLSTDTEFTAETTAKISVEMSMKTTVRRANR